jgi:hypothetical protein
VGFMAFPLSKKRETRTKVIAPIGLNSFFKPRNTMSILQSNFNKFAPAAWRRSNVWRSAFGVWRSGGAVGVGATPAVPSTELGLRAVDHSVVFVRTSPFTFSAIFARGFFVPKGQEDSAQGFNPGNRTFPAKSPERAPDRMRS